MRDGAIKAIAASLCFSRHDRSLACSACIETAIKIDLAVAKTIASFESGELAEREGDQCIH